MKLAERIAREFHQTYESLAPKYDYPTSAPWEEASEDYRKLMIATVQNLLDRGSI